MTPEEWHRVKEVFEEAREHAPEQRSAFLGQACAGDELLLGEVKSLLSSYDQERSFLETPAAALAAQSFVKEESAALVGHQFGHFQVDREIGRGGMGVVYLAQDVSLGRPVALKLLPKHLTSDPNRLRRFEREARAASALNHPNILTIYEIAQLDGLQTIATEFVDGMTLRERISAKDLQLSEALNIAEQIASALVAAHEAGIVHRDIKPENVMLRRDGYVKVLDFGLAKLTEHDAADVVTSSRSMGGINTDTGVMGTVGYMSPEQAQGQSVDKRTDVFSFGVVIYEMVTGQMPFAVKLPANKDVPNQLEPLPLAHYLPEAPPELQLIVTKALHRDRDTRYQTMAELLGDLKSVRSKAVAKSVFTARRLSLLAAILVLMIAGSLWFYASRHAAKSSLPPMKVFAFTSFPGKEVCPAFSPDGKRIAFAWSGERDDNWDIYVKQIENGNSLRLTSNAAVDLWPVWSPDGTYIAFSRRLNSEIDGGIYIIPAMGGAERRVYSLKWENAQFGHIDWSPDGKSLAFQERDSPQESYSLFLLSLETLEKRKLTSPREQYLYGDWSPAFSPDGQTLAFMRDSSIDTEDIYLVPVAGGEPRRLTFDNTLLRGMAWTPDGNEIVFTSMRGGSNLRLWRVSVSGGTPEPLAAGGEKAITPAISRQGNLLAYAQDPSGSTKIWRIEVSKATGRGSSPVKFIASTRDESTPQYSSDGKRIAFASDRSGSEEIWVCDSDGSNQVKLTNFGGPVGGSPHWSPDRRQIAFDTRPEGYSQIYVINAEGGQPRRITTGKSDDVAPTWSKDGRWIYFSSNRGGEQQMWKVPAEGGEAVQVTGRSGFWGAESLDGEFFYYEVENAGVWTIWRVPVEGGQEAPVIKIGKQQSYDVAAVTEQGIYFTNLDAKPQPEIELFSFATGRVKQIATIGKERGNPGLAISPDGRWILYTEVESNLSGDIMLVENFR
jgi:Tol biopolymer transport system component/tRNA A-37 threonylcarbamoyl transferase component Bud32